MRGFGSHIYNDLRKVNGLAIETLIEFIIIEEMGTKLQQFIETNLGNYEIIEHFSSFYRFRLTANITVGKIFSGFETNVLIYLLFLENQITNIIVLYQISID